MARKKTLSKSSEDRKYERMLVESEKRRRHRKPTNTQNWLKQYRQSTLQTHITPHVSLSSHGVVSMQNRSSVLDQDRNVPKHLRDRAEQARQEAQQKALRVAPAYNKGGLTYLGDNIEMARVAGQKK